MKFNVFLISILFLSNNALALTKLNWNTCVQQVLDSNPDLKTAERNYESSHSLLNASYSGFYPQLSATLGYTYGTSYSYSSSLSTLTTSSDPASVYTASLSASENLFSGFQDEAKVNQAKANLEISSLALKTAKAKVSSELKTAYASYLYAKNLFNLSNEIIKRREYNLRLVQLRFENGGENQGSVLLSKAYLEQAKLDLFQAKNLINLSQIELKKVLGMQDSQDEIELVDAIPVADPLMSSDLAEISKLTPTYLTTVKQVDSAKAALDLAQANFYPSLNLTGSTSDTDSKFFPGNNRWSLGLAITIPIFTGGKDYHSYKSYGELYRAAVYTRQSTEWQSLQTLRQALSDYTESLQKYSLDKAFAQAAIVRAKIAREKYNNGLLTFDEWDVIETDLISRQKSEVLSEKNQHLMQAAWELAQGKGVFQ